MPQNKQYYTTQLGQGLGLIEETKTLFELYEPGMTSSQLYDAAMASGRFPLVTARRLRNIVAECFAPRYLKQPNVAEYLKKLQKSLSSEEHIQLQFLYTARASFIFAEFVRYVYWPRYESGGSDLERIDALDFIEAGISEGKTRKPWSDSVIRRVASYLLGASVNFGFLEEKNRNQRTIKPYHLSDRVAAYLVYELKLSGLGDNNIVNHSDWQLFGLEPLDVRDYLKRLSLKGFLIYQATAEVVHIGWTYKDMWEVINVIAER